MNKLPYNITIKILRLSIKNITVEEFEELLKNSSIDLIAYFNNTIDLFFSKIRFKQINVDTTINDYLSYIKEEVKVDFHYFYEEEYSKLSNILMNHWDFKEDLRRYTQ